LKWDINSSDRKARQFATNQVQMKMVNTLPAMRTGIDDQTVPAFRNPFLFCKLLCYHHHMPNQGLISQSQVINRVNMPVGNDEYMRGCNGVNIPERRYELIAVENPGRRFTRNDLAKDTGHIHS
jgi:hypothetical protein